MAEPRGGGQELTAHPQLVLSPPAPEVATGSQREEHQKELKNSPRVLVLICSQA